MNNFFKNLFATSRYHTRRSKGVFHFCVVVALLLSKSQQQHQNIRFQSKKKLRYEIITKKNSFTKKISGVGCCLFRSTQPWNVLHLIWILRLELKYLLLRQKLKVLKTWKTPNLCRAATRQDFIIIINTTTHTPHLIITQCQQLFCCFFWNNYAKYLCRL